MWLAYIAHVAVFGATHASRPQDESQQLLQASKMTSLHVTKGLDREEEHNVDVIALHIDKALDRQKDQTVDGQVQVTDDDQPYYVKKAAREARELAASQAADRAAAEQADREARALAASMEHTPDGVGTQWESGGGPPRGYVAGVDVMTDIMYGIHSAAEAAEYNSQTYALPDPYDRHTWRPTTATDPESECQARVEEAWRRGGIQARAEVLANTNEEAAAAAEFRSTEAGDGYGRSR